MSITDDIDDIFNLPLKTKDKDDYFDGSDSISFEEKVVELNENLKEKEEILSVITADVEKNKKILQVPVNKELMEEKKIDKNKETEVKKSNIIVDDFNIIDDEEDVKKVEPTKVEKIDKMVEKEEEKVELKMNLSSEQWLLKNNSKDPKWDVFYEQKISLKDKFLVDGLIPFSRWKKELISAKVDISIESYSLEQILEKMSSLQRWKNRIQEMHIQANYQLFMLDRIIPMLKGVLARIEYLKPAERQEGMVFEHMSDFVTYHAEVSAISQSIDSVTKNLDKAGDLLSRFITVLMPNPMKEKVYGAANSSKVENKGVLSVVGEDSKKKSVQEELAEFDEEDFSKQLGKKDEVKKDEVKDEDSWDNLDKPSKPKKDKDEFDELGF